ncbi:MAG TPA: amidohydrolase family protein, partial [Prosthecobacter sp.]|nr:amidohydrolase family protein [Prosthecobacter sp.]
MRALALLTSWLLLAPAFAADALRLTLPPLWHGVAGVPLSLYFDNVVLTQEPGKLSFEIACDIGQTEARRWTVTPGKADVGDHAIEITVKDASGKILERAATILRIVPADAGEGRKLTLLMVGDSLTNATIYPNEIARLLSTPGNPKWQMIGTHKPSNAAAGVVHEGYGGWKWSDFLSRWVEKPKDDRRASGSSPFIFKGDGGKPALDFSRYFRDAADGLPPDVATFLLGINDCFRAKPDDPQDVERVIRETLDQAEKFITAFRKAAPRTAIAIGLTTPPNERQAAFQANYKDSYTRWGWKRIQHRLVEMMINQFKNREKEGIYLVATELNLDPVGGYPDNNAVHPNAEGYAEIGASFYGWLKAWLAGRAAPAFQAPDYDLVIRNARIVDGTGAAPYNGNILIKNGYIAGVGNVNGSAAETLDAQHRIVAPGFIDVHTHSEDIGEIPAAENFLRMGVTTIVTGNCGSSRTDVAQFFSDLEKTGATLNVATLIGHNSVREKAMNGRFFRPPNEEQMAAMKAMVDQAMNDGAVGLSTGLIYLPGTFAKTEEIIELAKVAASHNGIYASHMRAETVKIFSALDELIRIAREAGIRAEVSHLKLSGPTAWGKAAEVLTLLDKARADGLSITHDVYAYTASSTGLGQLIPDKAREGTREDYAARIDDPAQKAAIISEMNSMRERQGRQDYAYAVIARFKADPSLNGKSVAEAAKQLRGSDTLADQIEVILDIERRGGASAVFHGMNEEDLQAFLQHPLTMIASDGGPRRLGEDVPHPRSYGNNARVLARYVREQKLLKLEDAIRRMTSLPAQTFRLKDRGVIRTGAFADL